MRRRAPQPRVLVDFVLPLVSSIQAEKAPGLHRHQRQGYYGWAELGFGVLDNRRVLAGSF